MDGNGHLVQVGQGPGRLLDSHGWPTVRDEILACLSGAYQKILDERIQNYGLWQQVRQQLVQAIRNRYRAEGLTAPPLMEEAFWADIAPFVPSSDPERHVEYVAALLTDKTEAFWHHLQYRQEAGGNTHVQFAGATGLTKSSCAIGVADTLAPIEPHKLLDHVAIDLSDLFEKVERLRPGDTILLDEYLARAGVGSRTMQDRMDNLEDMLRASQINLFWASPHVIESDTIQLTLEVIFINPDRKFSLFLLWVKGKPRGVVALPWMRDGLYAVYHPWKTMNTKRALRGEFGDVQYTRRMAVKAFERPTFVSYLTDVANKPKKTDFRTALQFFEPRMVASAQVDDMVNFMHDVCYNYDRIGDRMVELFEVEGNEGLEKVARKCYEE